MSSKDENFEISKRIKAVKQSPQPVVSTVFTLIEGIFFFSLKEN